MAGNTLGQLFRVTTFGESHGETIGAVIDGCPAGLSIDERFIQEQLDRRRPGQSKITTQRKESDLVRIASGVFESKTTGAPICLLIANEDQRSKDYDHLKSVFRPSHADYTYAAKYGHRDHRGGGRSSARETAARVAAGAIARLVLNEVGISIVAYVSKVGPIEMAPISMPITQSLVDESLVRCPDPQSAQKMIALIEEVKKQGDSIGGIIAAEIAGCPVGLGEPVFDRLHADLGKAMLSIPAVKAFEYGSGFAGAEMVGSKHNDSFVNEGGIIRTTTHFSGGIQGGISNGMPIAFRVGFKPVATLLKPQRSVDIDGNEVEIEGRGRHDPCVVPRAVPIVEAMAALVLADHLLRARTSRLAGA